jgi:hypothetical protein
MNKIFKITLDVIGGVQVQQLPQGAKPLTVGIQNDFPVVWYEVDPEEALRPRALRTVTTGEEFDASHAEYIGTVVISGWHPVHVYEQHGGSLKIDSREHIREYHKEALRERVTE